MRPWRLMVVTILLWWADAASGAGVSLDAVVARLALTVPSQTHAFCEIRDSGLLSEPVKLHGELTVFRDGRFLKRTHHPDGREAVVRVHGDTVTIDSANDERTFSLARSPSLAAVVQALRALALGETAALRAGFDVAVTGDTDAWRIQLERPEQLPGGTVDPGPGGDVVRVTLAGHGSRLVRITLARQGQRTILELERAGSDRDDCV